MASKKAGKLKKPSKPTTLIRPPKPEATGDSAALDKVQDRVKKPDLGAAGSAPAKRAKGGETTSGGKAGSTSRGKATTSVPELSAIVRGIEVGDPAPSFVLKDDTGQLVSSESLRGTPYILYFYPKDDTPGCTVEACSFRDLQPRFTAKGVRIIGVSPDSPETHARFKKKYGLSFALLSDPEKTLALAYGVWVQKRNYGREYMGVERSTFHVDRRGAVRQVWRAVRVPGHVDTVLHTV